MKIILLDGVGAEFFLIAFVLGLLFIVVAVFIEALIMKWMKYHDVFKKAFLQSLTVNLVSLAVGFILFSSDSEFFQLDNTAGIITLYGITVVVEGLLLFLMNRSKPFARTVGVCAIMNLSSYAVAFLLISIINF